MQEYIGKCISKGRGIAIGPMVIYRSYFDRKREAISRDEYHKNVATEEQKASNQVEWIRLETAMQQVMEELQNLRNRTVNTEGGQGDVQQYIDAQLLLLQDEGVLAGLKRRIEQEGDSAQNAVIQVQRSYEQMFAQMSDAYMRERVQDVQDVMLRLLKVLDSIGMEDSREALRTDPHGIEDSNEMTVNTRANKKTPWLLEPSILVAKELLPSELLELASENLLGLALEKCGSSSHVAILARSMNIPVVVFPDSNLTSEMDMLLSARNVDACIRNQAILVTEDLMDTGKRSGLLVDPSDEMISRLLVEPSNEAIFEYETIQEKTVDGDAIHTGEMAGNSAVECKKSNALLYECKESKVLLYGNVCCPEDVKRVFAQGVEGIGLYRSELSFLNRDTLPSEDEQYIVYKNMLEAAKGKPFVFRVFDLAEDKLLKGLCEEQVLDIVQKDLRGLAFLLKYEDFFRRQLKALCRASRELYSERMDQVTILLPMVRCTQEVLQAKEIIGDIWKEQDENVAQNRKNSLNDSRSLERKNSLNDSRSLERKNNLNGSRNDNAAIYRKPQIGVMIETPEAVDISNQLARIVDSFSIGTNDLISLTLGLDRESMDDSPMDLSRIWKSIECVVANAHKEGIPVEVCGEWAANPIFSERLITMGVDILSR